MVSFTTKSWLGCKYILNSERQNGLRWKAGRKYFSTCLHEYQGSLINNHYYFTWINNVNSLKLCIPIELTCGWNENLNCAKFYCIQYQPSCFSCAHTSAGSRLSNVWFLATDKEKLLRSWGYSRQNPHVSHMKAPALLTSGKNRVNEGRRGRRGEVPVRLFFLSLEDYGSRAVCKDSPAWMQLPSLFWGKWSTPLSEGCSCDGGGCDRGICIPGGASSPTGQPRSSEAPFLQQGLIFSAIVLKPVRRKFYYSHKEFMAVHKFGDFLVNQEGKITLCFGLHETYLTCSQENSYSLYISAVLNYRAEAQKGSCSIIML